LKNGYGLYYWEDGRKYEGFYKNEKKHGYGKYFWTDGRKYFGYWDNGKQHGLGKYIQNEENFKIGMWTNGKRAKWLSNEELIELKDNAMLQKILKEK